MISQSQIDYFRKTGIWYTGLPCFNPRTHIECLKSFLSRDSEYKRNFLQTKFKTVFEGYSYMGQPDSLNQGAYDNLYTYVLSEFFDQNKHPREFDPLFAGQYELIPKIKKLERELLANLDAGLLSFYNTYGVHSLSANYYPPNDSNSLRLTEHPDGSLLTVFPFGMDEEFQFEMPDGSWQAIEKTDEIVCFSGYLMECLTGDIKALNHKVVKEGPQGERFSFAYFSIPAPGSTFQIKDAKTSTEAYLEKYLSLFD